MVEPFEATVHLSGAFNDALELLLRSLKDEAFGILSVQKIRLPLEHQVKVAHQVAVIRAYYPCWDRAHCLATGGTPVRCSAVLHELSSGELSLKLSKPVRILEPGGDPSMVRLSSEADHHLDKVLNGLRLEFDTPAPQTARAG